MLITEPSRHNAATLAPPGTSSRADDVPEAVDGQANAGAAAQCAQVRHVAVVPPERAGPIDELVA